LTVNLRTLNGFKIAYMIWNANYFLRPQMPNAAAT
jgi:hypothetical protein